MPFIFRGQTYYRATELAETVGISRSALLRWVSNGILKDIFCRDKGWGLFTPEGVGVIEEEACKVK